MLNAVAAKYPPKPSAMLQLVDSKIVGDGIAILVYRPANDEEQA